MPDGLRTPLLLAVGDIVSYTGDMEHQGFDNEYVIGMQNAYVYVFQYLPTAWSQIKILTASGAAMSGQFGAAWNFQNSLYFAANNGNSGVIQPDMLTVDLAATTVTAKKVGSSTQTYSNDGANCMNVHIPFGTCGDQNGNALPNPNPITDAQCSAGGGTWYYRDSNAKAEIRTCTRTLS